MSVKSIDYDVSIYICIYTYMHAYILSEYLLIGENWVVKILTAIVLNQRLINQRVVKN